MTSRLFYLSLLAVSLLGGWIWNGVTTALTPERMEVAIPADEPALLGTSLKIALLADLHLDDTEEAYARMTTVIQDVHQANPDLVVLAGDYTKAARYISDMSLHQRQVAEVLRGLSPLPVVAVLGNYETATGIDAWRKSFEAVGIPTFENEVQRLRIRVSAGETLAVCLRGLGDRWSRRFEYVPFPEDCVDALPLTVTHDPGGAFEEGVAGLVLSGHTHCGQVRLPFLGAPYVPTRAPETAWCGLYQDDERTLFVSAGLGTSVLPIRFGAQAGWELLTLSAK